MAFDDLTENEILERHNQAGGRWLTVPVVARRWGCHRSKVYRLLAEKQLHFLRLGSGRGSLRVSSFWLAEFEARNLNRL